MIARRIAAAVLVVGSVAFASPSFAQVQAAGVLAPAAATGAVTTAVITAVTAAVATVVVANSFDNTTGTTGTR
jgi:hypothetical protein